MAPGSQQVDNTHQIDISGKRLIDAQEIELASEHWARIQMDQMRIRDLKCCRRWFVETTTSWLRFLGRLAPTPERKLPLAGPIDDFSGYMSEERGLSTSSVLRYPTMHKHSEEFVQAQLAGAISPLAP